MLMTMSFISPVLILSIFPHQEPRFLIPILVPLVYLHSEQILPQSNSTLVKTAEATSIQDEKRDHKKKNNDLLKVWLAANVIMLGFYGFVHQGGVFNAVNFLQKDLKYTPTNTEIHIVTSHVYSMPQSFFLQKAPGELYTNRQQKYSVKQRVFLYEEGSKDLIGVISRLKSVFEAKRLLVQSGLKPSYSREKSYLLVTSSRLEQAELVLQEVGVGMSKLDSFWPHVSTEALPDFTRYCFNPTFIFYKNCNVLPLWDYVKKISELCELRLYELDFGMGGN